jgi:RNA polymerase sigma-70 factor (ECF subfamily)
MIDDRMCSAISRHLYRPMHSDTESREPASTAIPRLFDRYGDRIYRMGLHLCDTPQDAEDMVQETFVRALKSWERFEGRSSPYTWLHTIAARVCARQHRRRAGEPSHVESLDRLLPSGDERLVAVPIADESELTEQVRTEVEDRVRRCTAALPLHFQLPLVLKDLFDFSTTEVAEILGIKEGTVRTRVYRARMRLRRDLAQALPTRECSGVDHPKRICLDLLFAKQEALDHGVPFPLPQQELCERCHSVFATLDLTQKVFQKLHEDGALSREVRRALREELDREYAA